MAGGRRPLAAAPLLHKHGGESAPRGPGRKPAAQARKRDRAAHARERSQPAGPCLDATHAGDAGLPRARRPAPQAPDSPPYGEESRKSPENAGFVVSSGRGSPVGEPGPGWGSLPAWPSKAARRARPGVGPRPIRVAPGGSDDVRIGLPTQVSVANGAALRVRSQESPANYARAGLVGCRAAV